MPDTLTPERLADIRRLHAGESAASRCEVAELIAHLDALTAAVEALLPDPTKDYGLAGAGVTARASAIREVLAILRGES